MTRQVIDTTTDHGTYRGDPGKTAFEKANGNFEELYRLYQPAANRLGYFDGSGNPAFTTLTAAARALLDDADVQTMRATLGLGSAALVAALGSVGNGDITEYIANANGQCWRFVNGLQLCKHIFNVVGPTQAFGALFISPSAATWTFPALFVGEQPIIIPQNSAESVWALGGTGPNQNANALFRCIYPASLGSTQTVTGMAIGRWK
ncbi:MULTISPECIES: hypothetical protein [unclassified Pseudomonas]|uniref:hypothetical protein n=1 Tax=unclassified Pseudomonas TaxID=196821 RepID=UPI00131AEA61|nr:MULTISPECIES: hypothetical protein [unclassified Pseudomonas]